MSKLPVVSGDETIKALTKIGYRPVRQAGSHVRLHFRDHSRKRLTVPRHKTIGKGLLKKILRDARLTVDEFRSLL